MTTSKIGLLICILPILGSMAASEQELSAKQVVNGINKFTVDFYLKTAEVKGADANVLVSPLSASLATAMLLGGARGETYNKLAEKCHYPSEKDLEQGFPELYERLKNTGNITLDIANRIFVEKSYALNADYEKKMQKLHKTEVGKADFRGNAEAERVNINNWVSTTTRDKIKELFPGGSLDTHTCLVLVNALYFKGKWMEPFDVARTHQEDFHVSKTNTIKVDMMHLSKKMAYAEIPELNATSIELYYEGKQVKMQIILPNEIDGLAAVEKKLAEGFSLSTLQYYPIKVDLSLPKFRLEDSIDLKEVYKMMDLGVIFSDEANFSGMSANEKSELKVSKGFQKTFMEVNEEGTEAAAATGIAMCLRMAMIDLPPVSFVVDHPFVVSLSLTDGPNLFLGRIVTPKA